MTQEYLTSGEAAGRLRVSEETIRRWCRAGRLPTVKIGRAHRIPLAAVLAYEHGEGPGQPPAGSGLDRVAGSASTGAEPRQASAGSGLDRVAGSAGTGGQPRQASAGSGLDRVAGSAGTGHAPRQPLAAPTQPDQGDELPGDWIRPDPATARRRFGKPPVIIGGR